MLKPKKIILLVSILITLFIGFYPSNNYDLSVIVTFVFIGIVSVFGVFFGESEGKGVSLNTVYWLFNYTFFFISPIVQFKNYTVFHLKTSIENNLYISAGVTILLTSILYFIFYNFFYNRSKVFIKDIKHDFNYRLLVFLSIITTLTFLYLIKFNFEVIFFRPKSGWLKDNTLFGNLGYAIISVIRYVPFFCLLFYLFSKENDKKRTIILLLLCLFTTFPLSLSRGILAALYIPLFLLIFPVLRKKYYFLLIFLISIVFIFPILNSFRSITQKGFVFDYELFNSPHFDAFQNFMLLLSEGITTNGSQLVNSFLFISDNVKSSGQILGETLNFDFYNIAIPYIGEGFINFSYSGIVIFILFIAFVNSFFDKRKNNLPIIIQALYYMLIGFEFYVLRGDLSSSIKKLVGFVLALLIVLMSSYIFNYIHKTKKS